MDQDLRCGLATRFLPMDHPVRETASYYALVRTGRRCTLHRSMAVRKLPGSLPDHRADADTQTSSLCGSLHEALRYGYFEVGWVLSRIERMWTSGGKSDTTQMATSSGHVESRATAIRAWRGKKIRGYGRHKVASTRVST